MDKELHNFKIKKGEMPYFESKKFYTGASTYPQFSYKYDYTYNYSWVEKRENLLATYKEGVDFEAKLTENRLKLTHEGKKFIFRVEDIFSIDIQTKKLMFHILSGGIMAPLLLIAIAKGGVNQFLGFMLIIVSLLMLYYGWMGRSQMQIATQKDSYQFFINSPSNRAVDFVNTVKAKISRQAAA